MSHSIVRSDNFENFVLVIQTYRHRFFESGVYFQVFCHVAIYDRPLSPFPENSYHADPAPTAPLPPAAKWVGLTVHGSDVLGWS